MKKFTKLLLFTVASVLLFPFYQSNAQSFTDLNPGFPKVNECSAVWGDYDNDDDLDILITGWAVDMLIDWSEFISRVYRNDSDGVFTDINTGLPGVHNGSATWGDYDNDGNLDILLTGFNDADKPISRIYRNDGDGTFTDINAGIIGVGYSSVAWGDYDNDGDLDILISGKIIDGGSVTKVYRNEGDGIFVDINAGLPGVNDGSAEWGDYDNDSNLDILLSGSAISKVYRNDGGGIFTDINAGLPGISHSSAKWGDYDNDGDLDFLLAGFDADIDTTPPLISRIYRNDGNGVFTDINAGLMGIFRGDAAWGDYDNDGDLDIALTGNVWVLLGAAVYRNDGEGVFTYTETLGNLENSSVAWGDYDNDGDLDIFLAGNYERHRYTHLFRNNSGTSNTTPSVPALLVATTSGNSITFNWRKSTDGQTEKNALTYNLRVGTTAGGVEVCSPMANVSSGYRKIAQIGNTNHDTTWVIRNLPRDKYYWSVQAIDNSFAGSGFSLVDSIIVNYNFISGVVFNDLNNNGMKGSGESGLAGWKIYISGNKTDSTITDTNGNYVFDSLAAGTYTVSEEVKSGWTQTLPISPGTYNVTLVEGENATGKDFGNYRPDGLVAYYPFSGNANDESGNGNDGIPHGTSYCADRFGNPNRACLITGNTNEHSNIFVGLPLVIQGLNKFSLSVWVNEYQIINNDGEGYVFFGQDNGIFVYIFHYPGIDSILFGVSNGIARATVEIPYNASFDSSFQHYVLVYDGDVGTVHAFHNGSSVGTQGGVSGIINFNINFGGIGKHVWYDGTAWSTRFNGIIDELRIYNRTLSPSEVDSLYHEGGWTGTGTISGTIFEDEDGNGVKNTGEQGLGNWTTRLFEHNVQVDTITTDATGIYTFSVSNPDTYTIRTDIKPSWTATIPPMNEYSNLIITGDTVISGKDFGYFHLGYISGQIYKDNDRDSIKDNGEPGLKDWLIKINGTLTDSTVTDDNGNYTFTGLPIGTYVISEELKPNWEQTYPPIPGTHSISISSSGQNYTNVDFGNYLLPPRVKIKLTVHDNSILAERNLYFGVESGATFGIWGVSQQATSIDSIEDEYELPPVMGGIFDSRFKNPRGGTSLFGRGSWTDIRDFTSGSQKDTHLVAFQPGAGGYPITFKWSKEEIIKKYGGAVKLGKNPGNWADMKTNDSLIVTNTNTKELFIITEKPIIPILYEPGWNLVSLPVTVVDGRKEILFPNATSHAFIYNPIIGYDEKDTLVPGVGYWLKFPIIFLPFTMDGIPRTEDTIDVTEGWNLIGTLSKTISPNTVGSIPPNIVTSDFFGYKDTYYFADSLEPLKAYWVKVNQDGKLILSTSSYLTATNRIKIISTLELPPLPPDQLSPPTSRNIPEKFSIAQNYPNPFNPQTRISFSVPKESYITLKVYDLLGREVATLVNEKKQPGEYSVTWSTEDVTSGVYFYRLVAGEIIETKRMVVMK